MNGPRLLILTFAVALGGCFSPSETLERGDNAYAAIPARNADLSQFVYRIGPLDTLTIRVFQEPDLSFDQIQVDAAGNINFPLVGNMAAAGKTPQQLGDEIRASLSSGFIRNPQVVVGVRQSVAQRVVVEGSVTEPGVYEIAGSASLLEAIALAKGPTRVADLDEVIVFRERGGQRMGAVFDLNHIREGRAPDPEIVGGDRIVIGFSAVKGAWRDFMAAAPLLNVFRPF